MTKYSSELQGLVGVRETMQSSILRVSRFQARTETLGPGLRAVIWFQGCSFDCAGCIAAEMNRSTDFQSVTPAQLVERLCQIDGIEGVTLSGGDPFDQPLDALAELVERIRLQSRLSIMCYTGRTLDQLRRGARAQDHARVLAHLDILVDGLYEEALNDGSLWRGSSNQRLHFLSERYVHLQPVVDSSRSRRVEVTLDRHAGIQITGIPPAGFMQRIRSELEGRGLRLDLESGGKAP